jgi:serine/threonine protein kinase
MINSKAFARKLLYIPVVRREEIEKEAQAIKRICGQGPHPHIINVLKLGELPDTSYYFIDMELCDLSLKDYINCSIEPAESIPFFHRTAPPPMKAGQIWNVMMQIAEGVKFLHAVNMVHRDLKPANGIPTLPSR